MTTKDIRALTRAQQDTLGRIALGEDTNLYNKKVIAVLLAKGLIETYVKELPHPRFPMKVTMYATPMPVHIAWCQWCSEVESRKGAR